MILAAGFGERMRPLTDVTPKPLLKVLGKPMIHYHLEGLAAAGVEDVVINTCHLAEQLENDIGNGQRWGLNVQYSREPEPLETAGGIIQALPILGGDPFLIVNGDIWTGYPFFQLVNHSLRENCLAHLVMIDNPPQHAQGDFYLSDSGMLHLQAIEGAKAKTYAGIAVYSPAFFDKAIAFEDSAEGKLPLKPLLLEAIKIQQVSAEYFGGQWVDVGTPQRLQQLNDTLALQ